MLRAVDIRTIAATQGVDTGIIEKDYVLTKTLTVLAGDAAMTDALVFKGGTALKKCYFPDWRFSEDLDFTSTVPLTAAAIMRNFARLAQGVIETFGVRMRVVEYSQYPGKGDTIVSAQLKLGYDGPLQKSSGQKNNIKVDLSFDESIVEARQTLAVTSSYADDSIASIPVYTLAEILAEKIRSILQRGKSRDFYDVWCLLKLYQDRFAIEAVWPIFVEKLEAKELRVPRSVEDFLLEARVSAARQFWEKGIAHQVSSLPDFDAVLLELRDLLTGFFGSHLI
ncbi:MAG: nucleotidyl transferase AbiEii/AbiGii toxin family protein [Candidatus Zixiibacteriota bacterium]